MSYRFDRKYKLLIRLSPTQVVEIEQPLRIQFDAKKTIKNDVNELKINIFNLAPDKRNKLVKDNRSIDKEGKIVKVKNGKTETIKLKDEYLQVIFQAGYDDLVDVFIGNIHEAWSVKSGPDWITTLICKDGGFDFRNSFTSKTVGVGVPIVEELLKDMPNTKKGKITQSVPRIRPKVLVGNTTNLIQENLEPNQTFFIDNEKLNVIANNELLEKFAVIVSKETGLLNAPQKQEQYIICETLFNPVIKIGGQVQLISSIIDLNSLYRVDMIQYSGDYRADDWIMVLYMVRSTNFKVLK